MLEKFCSLLCRRKSLTYTLKTDSKLKKCLTTLDLVFLGVSCTLGSGVFIVIGQVAKSMAGPSVILCFIVAGCASIFAGLCYAEFGARVPKAGSAYIYSYVAVGELWAFVIGWNIILEYVIGCAAVARATSTYIDAVSNYVMSTYLTQHVPIHVPSLSPFPDFVAAGFVLLFTAILCLGIHESSLMNNIFTVVNLFVVVYAVICGLFWVDPKNWSIPADQVPGPPEKYGHGGFFPFGVQGTLSGAATCFYAYVGFDIIAAAGEESVNAVKSIPRAILLCLLICSVSYIIPSVVLTMMLPYYELHPNAALPVAFRQVGWPVAEYIISFGAICSLVACLLVSCVVMPRVIYAMAIDGLLFTFLGKINERFQTPIYATVISGIITSVLALIIELKDLIEMLSIGTLLAYTLVAACVIQLRYEPPDTKKDDSIEQPAVISRTWRQAFVGIFWPETKHATVRTFTTVRICLGCAAGFTIWSGLIFLYLSSWLLAFAWWAILLVVVPLVLFVVSVCVMALQPQNLGVLTFQVPLVPLVPAASLFINIYLMINLHPLTWVRFIVWMVIGFLIYFFYGIHHDTKHIRSEDSDASAMEIKATDSNYGTVSDAMPKAAVGSINDDPIIDQSDKKTLVMDETENLPTEIDPDKK